MPVTLKQLAHELGLHHSTVAYALSGKGTVKEETRQRVREAAQRSGYVPNGLARRMRARKTNVVGLVIPDVHIGFNEFVQGIFRGSMTRGYDAQVALTDSKQDWEDKAVRFLIESRVDGMIVKSAFPRWADVPEHHALRQLVSQKVPTVLHGTLIEGSPFPFIRPPFERQGAMLTEHLLSLGHTRLAWLVPSHRALDRSHQARIDGSRTALRAAARDADALAIVSPKDAPTQDKPCACLTRSPSRVGVNVGRALMRQIIAMPAADRPTALLCVDESTAIGAIAQSQEAGLVIGEDIAIAAATRSVAADLSPVSLTTADVDIAEVARLALELLFATMKRMDGKPADIGKPPLVLSPAPKLVIGRSTRRAAAAVAQ